jgi:TRAP-type uncharacterized transport system fused permease subunit
LPIRHTTSWNKSGARFKHPYCLSRESPSIFHLGIYFSLFLLYTYTECHRWRLIGYIMDGNYIYKFVFFFLLLLIFFSLYRGPQKRDQGDWSVYKWAGCIYNTRYLFYINSTSKETSSKYHLGVAQKKKNRLIIFSSRSIGRILSIEKVIRCQSEKNKNKIS